MDSSINSNIYTSEISLTPPLTLLTPLPILLNFHTEDESPPSSQHGSFSVQSARNKSPDRRFKLQSSETLKSLSLARRSPSKPSHPFVRDWKLRLAAQRYHAKSRIKLAIAARKSTAAEEQGALCQIAESDLLLQIAEQEPHQSALSPPIALQLARATRNTLIAEEHLAILKLKEGEALVRSLQDAVEEAHSRVIEAHHQVGSLLSHLNFCGIHVNEDPTMLSFLPPITLDSKEILFSDSLPSEFDFDSFDSDSGDDTSDAAPEGGNASK